MNDGYVGIGSGRVRQSPHGKGQWGAFALIAIALTSCAAPSIHPVAGPACESYESLVKNVLVQFIETGEVFARSKDDPASTGYRIGEGRRKRLLSLMTERDALEISPKQQCAQAGEGLCLVRVHCLESAPNAANTRKTYTLVLEERADRLDPIQLVMKFDDDNSSSGSLLFRLARSSDMAARLQKIED